MRIRYVAYLRSRKDLLRRLPEFDSEIRQEIARDSGEVMEQAYLLGSGAQQPLGVFIPTADGISTNRDASTGSTTTFTAAALIAAKYKLKAAYRRKTGSRAGARWLFHRDGISKIAQLSDSSVGFLMRPGRGLQDEDSDLLLWGQARVRVVLRELTELYGTDGKAG